MFNESQMAEFFNAYMVCALWSSNDDDGEPLDDNKGTDDIAPECQKAMRETCSDFIEANSDDLAEYCQRMESEEWSGMQRAGHDFWLTRCGHGVGFWARGLGALGKKLSDAAKVYGNVDLYIGDDGLIYGG